MSATVADMWRAWRRTDDVVFCTGRMVDPWQVLAGGLVPYWCESSSRSAVDEAQMWLAGSEHFDAVSVLPDPPGTAGGETAEPAHWRALAAFARRHGRVDSVVTRRYPLLPTAPARAGAFLTEVGGGGRSPGPLPLGTAIDALREFGAESGVLVV